MQEIEPGGQALLDAEGAVAVTLLDSGSNAVPKRQAANHQIAAGRTLQPCLRYEIVRQQPGLLALGPVSELPTIG
ncbi:hypothetical protein OIU35_11685 [Boseaceae bacterium BT-24-1]|nr:hypothetical protein [Boseaceae bacterium BT-24-1]